MNAQTALQSRDPTIRAAAQEVADLQRSLRSARAKLALLLARKRGQHIGRPSAVTPAMRRKILDLDRTPREVAEATGLSVRTVYRLRDIAGLGGGEGGKFARNILGID